MSAAQPHPSLGAGLAAAFVFSACGAALLAALSPWLGGAWVALKLAALLLAPTAPLAVTKVPPVFASHESFGQMVRLQRIVESTRRTMLDSHPTLPHGARIFYWEMPRLAEFAFQGSRALQVWYQDTTLAWHGFGGRSGFDVPFEAGIEFHYEEPRIAVTIPGRSIHLYQRGALLMLQGRYPEVDSLLVAAIDALPAPRGAFFGSLLVNRGIVAYNLGHLDTADSLAREATAYTPTSVELWALRATVAYVHGARDSAEVFTRRALLIDPQSPAALQIARQLGVTP